MFEGLRRIFGSDRTGEIGDPQVRSGGDPGIPAGVLSLGNASFGQAIRKYPLTVVDFWAPWCAPCRTVSPLIEQLSREYAGRVAFGKVNVDKEKWVASSYRVRSIPTIMMFSRGRSVDRILGAVSKRAIESRMKAHLDGGHSPGHRVAESRRAGRIGRAPDPVA